MKKNNIKRAEKNNISVIDHDSELKEKIPNPITEFYHAFGHFCK